MEKNDLAVFLSMQQIAQANSQNNQYDAMQQYCDVLEDPNMDSSSEQHDEATVRTMLLLDDEQGYDFTERIKDFYTSEEEIRVSIAYQAKAYFKAASTDQVIRMLVGKDLSIFNDYEPEDYWTHRNNIYYSLTAAVDAGTIVCARTYYQYMCKNFKKDIETTSFDDA
jgi:hypothetical protein